MKTFRRRGIGWASQAQVERSSSPVERLSPGGQAVRSNTRPISALVLDLLSIVDRHLIRQQVVTNFPSEG